MLLKFDYKLIVLVLKFRNDRQNQSENTLKCIKFKNYPEWSLCILKEKYEVIFEQIELIYEFGLALTSVHGNIEIDTAIEIFLKKDYDLEKHYPENFVRYMRRNLKRFTTLMDNIK